MFCGRTELMPLFPSRNRIIPLACQCEVAAFHLLLKKAVTSHGMITVSKCQFERVAEVTLAVSGKLC